MKNIVNIVIILTTLVSVQSSKAIRSVGNGGGEAEMHVLKQFSMIGVWLRFCTFEPKICFSGIENINSLSSEIYNILKIKDVKNVKIVNKNEYKTNIENQNLILIREALYIDLKTPRSNLQLFNIIIKQILATNRDSLNLKNIDILFPADGYVHENKLSAILKSNKIDYIVSMLSNLDLHKEILKKLNISYYTILAPTRDGYMIKSNGILYNVNIMKTDDDNLAIICNKFIEP